ncbi:MAG: glycosyltransferase family 4 protein [Halobacteriales archaeon]|nr:glycosyltransferase family 4 protein [Halobacteriales archaeon]
MRVGMLLRETYPEDIRVRKEAAALRAAGHEVYLLCLAGEGTEPAAVDGVAIERIDWDGYGVPTRAVNRASYLFGSFDGIWFRRARRFAAVHDIDVLHVHDLPLVRTGLWVARSLGDVRVIADLHENYPEAMTQYRSERSLFERVQGRLLRPISRIERAEREAVQKSDALVTVVEEARDHYIADCDGDPDRVHVVSNTVDLDRIDAMAQTPVPEDVPEGFVVSYVGAFGPHRGLETLIRALPDAPEEVSLLLVGAGSSESDRRLRQLAKTEGVADRVTFTGWVDFEDVPRYIAASDLATVPHRETGHTATTVPHKLFQYMALETPVLVTDVGPLGSIVRETESGVVVPPENPTATAETIAGLVGENLTTYGENGRRAVEEQYNWARDAERLRRVYDGLTTP